MFLFLFTAYHQRLHQIIQTGAYNVSGKLSQVGTETDETRIG